MKQRDWRGVTPLELLLAERLRRAETVVDETAEEERLRTAIKSAIESSFVVTRSKRHCVRLIDVQRAGRVPGAAMRLVASVIQEMGGVVARPRNRRMVNGFKHAEMDDLEANAYAKKLRFNPWLELHPEYRVQWEERKARRSSWRR
jgi:hypothetical protein